MGDGGARTLRYGSAVGAGAWILAAVALVPLAAAGAPDGDELVLTVPEATVQRLLDRASPLEGSTPSGLDYSIRRPRVTIRGGRILTDMAITVSGGVSLLGQTLALSVDGTLEGELVVRLDPRTRTVKGGLEIRKLTIKNLEDLSDTDELKAFLSENLTRFEYPLDFPTAEVPEIGMLLTGTITGIEIDEGRVVVRSRLTGGRMPRRGDE